MARVNVFLADELLHQVDAEAADSSMNRSALIQSALVAFLEARKRERETAAVRREMEKAAKGMDALAEKLGAWDPVKVIREFRDSRALRVKEPRKRYRAKSGGRRR
ncbi:MAG: hypothetical protein HY049_12490 [Acidobacteria bacterium]|nr:hypothetical protein [Acidobacteriota bacterium]